MRLSGASRQTLFRHQRRIRLFMLLCLCLGVWGYVVSQIAEGMQQPETLPGGSFEAIDPAAESRLLPSPRRWQMPYDSSFRDPFALPVDLFARRSEEDGKTGKAPPEPAPPPLMLQGIIGETALLLSTDGSVHLARVGDNTRDVRILEVQVDHVVVRFQHRPYTLHLQPAQPDTPAGP